MGKILPSRRPVTARTRPDPDPSTPEIDGCLPSSWLHCNLRAMPDGQILEAGWFRHIVLPLIAVALSLICKVHARRDPAEGSAVRHEDFAISTELWIFTMFAYLVYVTNLASTQGAFASIVETLKQAGDPSATQQALAQLDSLRQTYQGAGWAVLAYFGGLVGNTLFIRKYGWRSPEKMRPFLGIWGPNFLSLGPLFSLGYII